ncbi:MAG: hypothetical protein WB660_05125 [Candidatus Sulfotelmatobacter sp.]
MSSKPSETMMELLKELVLLKELDQKYEGGAASDTEIAECEVRKNRRREITEQIKALAEPLA